MIPRLDASFEETSIERILVLLEGRTTDMVREPAVSPPVARYLDEATLARERELLFRRHPLVVAHASELAKPGDFVTHDHSGTPLLLSRDTGGRLHAFLNVCRHRGTRVVNEAAGSGRKAFVCPYHAWTYSTAGELQHVPHDYGFPGIGAEGVALAEVASLERAGLVFARPAPGEGVDAAAHLAPIDKDLAALGLESHVIHRHDELTRRLNWKIAIEIFLEGYHVRFVHKDSIAPVFFDNVSLSESLAPHYRGVFPKRTIRELARADRASWRLREHANVLYVIFPNTLVLVQPDHVSIVAVFPEAVDRTRLVARTLIPEAATTDKARGYWDRNVEILLGAIKEDLAIGETIQAGLASGANEQFRLARFEHGLRFFHEALGAAL